MIFYQSIQDANDNKNYKKTKKSINFDQLQFSAQMDKFLTIFTHKNIKNNNFCDTISSKGQTNLAQYNKGLNNIQNKEENYLTDSCFGTANFQNGFEQLKKYRILRRVAIVQTILIIINSFSLYIYYQFSSSNKSHDAHFLIISFIVNLLISLLQLVTFLFFYQEKDKNQERIFMKIIKCLLIMVLHPFPWMQSSQIPLNLSMSLGKQDSTIKINFILLIITLLRNILMIIPSICYNLYYYQPRTQRIYRIHSNKNNLHLFATKCIFTDMPFRCVAIFYAITVIYCSFSIRLLERNATCNNGFFSYYQNSIWYVMITISTVGFGEVTVCTTLGYIITMFSIIIGVFNTSLIVMLLINLFQFNFQEIETYNDLKNVEYTCQYLLNAKKYIRVSLWRLWQQYSKKKIFQAGKQQEHLRKKLRQMRRKYKNMLCVNKNQLFNQMENNFYQIQRRSLILTQNNFKILNFINTFFVDEHKILYSMKALQDQIKQKGKKYGRYSITNKIKQLVQKQYNEINQYYQDEQKEQFKIEFIIPKDEQKIVSIECIEIEKQIQKKCQ